MTIEELMHEKRLMEAGIRVAIAMFSEKTTLPVMDVSVKPLIAGNGHITGYAVSADVRVP